MLVFGKALAEYEGALGVDEIVLVRGRVDHKDSGQDGADRAERRAASSRPPEEVEAAREAAAARAAGPAAAARCASTPRDRRAGDDHRRAQARAREPPGRDRGRARHRRPPAARARCASARASASRQTPTLRAELEQILGAAALGRRAAARRLTDVGVTPRLARASRGSSPTAGPAAGPLARRVGRAAFSPRSRSALAQLRAPRRVGPLRSSARASRARTAGPRSAARTGTRAQPVAPELALADVRVAVAVGAERRLAVVEVQRAEPLEADDARRSRRAPRRAPSAVRMS